MLLRELMKRNLVVILIALIVLTACANGISKTNEPTPGLPTPVVQTTSLPDVTQTVLGFLEKWNANDYAGMYTMLAPTSRDAITEENFIKAYSDTAINLTLEKLLGLTDAIPERAQVVRVLLVGGV